MGNDCEVLVSGILIFGLLLILLCLILAGIIAWSTRPRKPKEPKCECFEAERRDDPYCPVHGVTRSAIRAGGRHGD
jgi:hypothetical protein